MIPVPVEAAKNIKTVAVNKELSVLFSWEYPGIMLSSRYIPANILISTYILYIIIILNVHIKF